ncbi:MAG: hypothetical protein DI564_10955 [Rhodanobacter denitrificans]|uniref:Uncharacterized protein n=1 Tax=Rhodanobacter denitrificans TaxID=666685 RepID=A0A2W5KDE9_9GAMM|nr:MAG: hypothetical protein DI564_10955 [Rhodanobacter denitrificans]
MNAPAYAGAAGDVVCDRDTVLGIWRGNLGQDARMQAKYDWFYAQCPFGAPLLRLLRHGADAAPVGAAAAGPRRMLRDGRPIEAGVLVDLAVLPEHRSLGPALMLQGELARAGGERFDLLYGFPNPKAAAVFKRVGYDRLGEIVRRARVLRHAGYLARRLPRPLAAFAGFVLDRVRAAVDAVRAPRERLVASWSDRADARFDALWSASPKGDGLVGVRDAAFARWRFDASPLATTRYLLLAGADGALRAWFACQVEDGVLHVRDFWSDDAATGIGHARVAALLRAARQAGHAAVSVEYAGPDARLAGWSAAGFVERSRRPVFGRWSDGSAAAAVAIHLTSADEDE